MTKLLPLWNDTPTRQAVLDFVNAVTNPDSPDFVPPEERIAVFDNDGTLWCEKPMYIQFDYFLRSLAEQAQKDTSLRAQQPWQAAWEKDFGWLGGAITQHYQGDDSDFRILIGGILTLSRDQPVEKIEAAAKHFVEQEHHPLMDVPYQECIYLPMLKLLRYLETNGFINYIVSGGGRDFMRGFAHDLYGIPRERVIGSTVAYRYMEDERGITIVQQPELDVIDDGPGKVIQIWNVIGRRPILAAGNSNGDIEMLKYTQTKGKPFLNLLLLHDDAEREYAYEQGAEKALSLAEELNWQIVSIKSDFQQVFAQVGSQE
jgi:phosphoglycolate phosphatase-like HAD superfamily hydrolase